MRQFSFSYIEKYAPSKQQLKTYLLKKYLRTSIPNINKKNISDLIDVVIQDLEQTKFINDKYYSKAKAKNLIKKGSSINKIRNCLLSDKQNYPTETISKLKKTTKTKIFSTIKLCKKTNWSQRMK